MSPVSPTLAGVFFTTELPGKPPLQYFYLENPTDRGAWRATVHGVAKSWTRLSDSRFYYQALSLPSLGEYPSLSAPSLFTYWEPEKQFNNPIRHYTK